MVELFFYGAIISSAVSFYMATLERTRIEGLSSFDNFLSSTSVNMASFIASAFAPVAALLLVLLAATLSFKQPDQLVLGAGIVAGFACVGSPLFFRIIRPKIVQMRRNRDRFL